MTQLNSLTDLIPDRQNQQIANSTGAILPEGAQEWGLNPDTGHLEVIVTTPASIGHTAITLTIDDDSPVTTIDRVIQLVTDQTVSRPSTVTSMFRLNGVNEDQTEWTIDIETSGDIVFNNIEPRDAAIEFWNRVQELARNNNVRV